VTHSIFFRGFPDFPLIVSSHLFAQKYHLLPPKTIHTSYIFLTLGKNEKAGGSIAPLLPPRVTGQWTHTFSWEVRAKTMLWTGTLKKALYPQTWAQKMKDALMRINSLFNVPDYTDQLHDFSLERVILINTMPIRPTVDIVDATPPPDDPEPILNERICYLLKLN